MMKKDGMTLPEILISLAIIGIISAIIIPMANNSKPDETKALFLKNYDELTRAVKELASNTRIFPVCNNFSGVTYCFDKGREYPFMNTDAVSDANNNTIFHGGNPKFCEALAFQYDVYQDNKCSDSTSAYSFITKNGASYKITTERTFTGKDNASFISEISIDVNGSGNGNDCIYANNCSSPDMFRFWVTGDGEIISGDEAGHYYIRTRENSKNKHIELNKDDKNVPKKKTHSVLSDKTKIDSNYITKDAEKSEE